MEYRGEPSRGCLLGAAVCCVFWAIVIVAVWAVWL